MKFATVSDFKGKKYVNIREYYEKDGDLKPGKKGLFSLYVEEGNARCIITSHFAHS